LAWGLVQRFLRVRALNGDRRQGRDPFDDVVLVRTGTAGLAVVHREGSHHPALGGQHGRGPACSQRMREGELAVVGPQGVGGDVRHDHGLGPVRRRPTRTLARADGDAVDGLRVASRQAGRRAVPQVATIRIQQQDRAEDVAGPLFDEPAQSIEDEDQRITPGHHLEKPLLSGQERLGQLSVFDVGGHAVPPHDLAPLVLEWRHPHQEPPIDSVRASHAHLDLERFPRFASRAAFTGKRLAVFGMKRACPARALGIVPLDSRVLQPPSVDALDRATGQGDAGQRGNRIDHEGQLIAEARDLQERRASPRYQAGHDKRRRQEGE
jgi:hypothetical protein